MQEDERYRIIVDDETFNLSPADLDDFNAAWLEEDVLHTLVNDTSYRISIQDQQNQNKRLVLLVNNVEHHIQIKRPVDLIIDKVNLTSGGAKKAAPTKAPMPGLVLEVKVKMGQKVKVGDGLVILEAMKMENLIKASSEGIVKKIHVDQGHSVDKGQVLIEID